MKINHCKLLAAGVLLAAAWSASAISIQNVSETADGLDYDVVWTAGEPPASFSGPATPNWVSPASGYYRTLLLSLPASKQVGDPAPGMPAPPGVELDFSSGAAVGVSDLGNPIYDVTIVGDFEVHVRVNRYMEYVVSTQPPGTPGTGAVPDGGSALSLLGLAFAGLAGGRRLRRSLRVVRPVKGRHELQVCARIQ